MKRNPRFSRNPLFSALVAAAFLAGLASLVLAPGWARADKAGDPAAGKTTYQSLCLSCHGESGHGDGPVGKFLKPKPANLSEELTEHDDDFIFKVIKEGGPSVGKSASMPAWGSQLKDDDIRDVISYIRTFAEGQDGHPAEKDEAHKPH